MKDDEDDEEVEVDTVDTTPTEDKASPSQVLSVKKPTDEPEFPMPDNTGSKTQMKPSGKAGWCYIGEDRGFRSCLQINQGDKCMSGDIYSNSRNLYKP